MLDHVRSSGSLSVDALADYDRYSRDILRHCRFIRPLLMRTPPDPTSFRPRDLNELMYIGKKFFDLSETGRYPSIEALARMKE